MFTHRNFINSFKLVAQRERERVNGKEKKKHFILLILLLETDFACEYFNLIQKCMFRFENIFQCHIIIWVDSQNLILNRYYFL